MTRLFSGSGCSVFCAFVIQLIGFSERKEMPNHVPKQPHVKENNSMKYMVVLVGYWGEVDVDVKPLQIQSTCCHHRSD
jgi:hypothetical protein